MSKLYLVGVGPGDPELLTLKAVRLIEKADIVAFPQKPDEVSLALRIAEPHLLPNQQRLAVTMPMQVDRSAGIAAYDAAAQTILEHIANGHTVAYLCEGDPLLYGSAMYFLQRLPDDAQVEIVPGITSLTAAAAAIKRPLAARSDRLKILPATGKFEDLESELQSTQACAIIKVGRHLPQIRQVLERTGHLQSAMIVEYATHADQQSITPLAEYKPESAPYFSIILTYRGQESWGQ